MRKFLVVLLIAAIACTEVAVTETVQDVEMKSFIRKVVDGVKNVIGHVRNKHYYKCHYYQSRKHLYLDTDGKHIHLRRYLSHDAKYRI